jgi:asparagine synthase (glutamine-hydrolysing)
MCGIAGMFTSQSSQYLVKITSVMAGQMQHRGPDDAGLWSEDGIALSHRRLAIIDLSPGGHQPMMSVCGRYVITFNGEIYNYLSLKEELKAYAFKSSSDTEVILAAFSLWGTSCFARLRGQFALCIYDRQEKHLIMARDRIGEKPFYYHLLNDTFLFASEIRALLATELVAPNLEMRAVADFLRYQSVTGPETMIEGVYSLPPASYGIYKKGSLEITTYWSIDDIKLSNGRIKKPALLADIKNVFSDAVKEQMQSDVPLGAFLSGGIDSSAIVAMMSRHSNEAVHTFHVSFDQKAYDESHYAEMIAKQYQTKHTRILLRPESLLEEMPSILKSMDAPSGDGPNTYMISKAVKDQGIKVVMSGLGGDDLFAGYPGFLQYQKLRKFSLFWKLPASLRSAFGDVLAHLMPDNRGDRLHALLNIPDIGLAEFYSWSRRIFSEDDLRRLSPAIAKSSDSMVIKMQQWLPEASKLPVLGQYGIAELKAYTANVLLKDADVMSMAHSIEIRCPFLDHRLIELALETPDAIKYPHYPKQLLVEAISPDLPESLVKRRKMGFSFPWDHWLRHNLASFVAINIESLASRPWFDKKEVMAYYWRFKNGDSRVHWSRIWLRENIDNRQKISL